MSPFLKVAASAIKPPPCKNISSDAWVRATVLGGIPDAISDQIADCLSRMTSSTIFSPSDIGQPQ